jgi:glycosyltransferase involved in cell wall biosynthesis
MTSLPTATPIYLRTDMVFGLVSGGSIAHVSGVFNHLDAYTHRPTLFTTDHIPGIRPDLEVHNILPGRAFLHDPEIAYLHNTAIFEAKLLRLVRGKRVGFIYQRYSTNNFSGVRLKGKLRVPLVLEFNGSEVWVNSTWGRPLKYQRLTESIESLNFQKADVVVVVSEALRDALISQGVVPQRILVNPNGVDVAAFSPAVDGSLIRRRWRLDGKVVVGFIGTFEPWHGIELLVDAFAELVKSSPAAGEKAHLLLIGSGQLFNQIKLRIASHGIQGLCTLAGRVEQEKAPAYLAACDVLVSPTLPNKDCSPFFGSPTKLFEYMAMGKGIIASDLDQLGQVLTHGVTARLTVPGDVGDLKDALATMIDNPGYRERLGRAARERAVAQYTWREHVRKIIVKLKTNCPTVEGVFGI